MKNAKALKPLYLLGKTAFSQEADDTDLHLDDTDSHLDDTDSHLDDTDSHLDLRAI